jgi:hypothetical protein
MRTLPDRRAAGRERGLAAGFFFRALDQMERAK